MYSPLPRTIKSTRHEKSTKSSLNVTGLLCQFSNSALKWHRMMALFRCLPCPAGILHCARCHAEADDAEWLHVAWPPRMAPTGRSIFQQYQLSQSKNRAGCSKIIIEKRAENLDTDTRRDWTTQALCSVPLLFSRWHPNPCLSDHCLWVTETDLSKATLLLAACAGIDSKTGNMS